MFENRRVLINAITSVVQVTITSIALIILYKFLLKSIGVDQLGLWSLLIAITSVIQVTNLGLSASVVKYVANYISLKQHGHAADLLQTAIISLSIISSSILLVAFPILSWLIQFLVPDTYHVLVISILPYALLSCWLIVLTNIAMAGLDGLQRIYQRNLLLMGAAIANLILCWLLVPKYGLAGVVFAKIVQYIFVLIICWFILRRYIPSLPIIPKRWDSSIFKEIIPYSINFQTLSLINLLFDPITKVLLSKFGDISTVGYYEMANKMVQLFRSILVSANQVMVPAFAGLMVNFPEKITSVYLKSYKLIVFLSLPLFSSIILCAPIISNLWIGSYEKNFVLFVTVLALGWFFSTLSTPAYFANIGTGKLQWNINGQATIGVANIILGFLLGMTFGGAGVVVAWSTSLILGSSVIQLSYHITNRISLIQIIPENYRYYATICIGCVVPAIFFQTDIDQKFNIISLNGSIIGILVCIIGISLWLHPMRREIISWIFNEV